MSEKDKISLYKLNNGDVDAENYIYHVIKDYHDKLQKNKKLYKTDKYAELKLEKNKFENYEIKVFYYKRQYQHPWKSFLNPVVVEKETQKWNVLNHDFIVFVYNESNSLYAFTSGFAYNVLTDYIDEYFPIEVAKRFLDPNKINKLNERTISGNIYAIEQYFRSLQTIFSNENFGRIPKEFRGIVRESIFKDKNYQELFTENKIIHCDIKTSFTLHKNLNFEQCINLIKKLDILYSKELTDLEKEYFDFFTSIKKIPSKNKMLIASLTNVLMQEIYECFNSGTELDFDFCHKNYDLFLNADSYCMSKILQPWDSIESINFYVNKLKEIPDFKNIKDFNDFEKEITRVSVISRNNEDEVDLTRGKFIEHIHGEIRFEGRHYFLLDRNWYLIDSSFLTNVNKRLKDVLKTVLIKKEDSFLSPWTSSESEGEYNEKYINKDSFIYGDKICVDNIELFDIMRISDDEIKLIHVKHGFDTSIRDVCSQIRSAARLIEESRTSDYNVLKNFYNQTIKYNEDKKNRIDAKNKLKRISEKDFVGYFNKKITYILAFKDKATSNRILNASNVELFESNIAKFEIIMLSNYLKGFNNIDFKICQVFKK